MAGQRYSKDEIRQVQALIDEGLNNKEIATKLGRSEAGIRNLRCRQGLKDKVERQIKTLFQQRNTLSLQVSELQTKRSELSSTIGFLEKRKSKVEGILNLDRSLLRVVLIQSLTRLKQERPELFAMSEQEQILALTNLFLRRLFS